MTISTRSTATVLVTLAGLFLNCGVESLAQTKNTESATINGKKVTIEYLPIAAKDASALGTTLPLDRPWDVGNAVLITEARLELAKCVVNPGTYNRFVVPSESANWQFIVAKQPPSGEAYDQSLDVCRKEMTKGSSGTTDSWSEAAVIIIRIPTRPIDLGFSLIRVAYGKGEAEIMFSAE